MPTLLVPPPAGANCSCGASPPPAHTAVILETRASPALEFAVLHMACSLPEDWGLMLVGTRAMRGFIRAAFAPLLRSRRLAVWELQPHAQELQRVCPLQLLGSEGEEGGGSDGGGGSGSGGSGSSSSSSGEGEGGAWCAGEATAQAWRVPRSPAFDRWTTGWDLANQVLMTEPFYRAIPTERFLIFQTDGLLCRPLGASDLAALQRYDYVGSPWRWDPMGLALLGVPLLPSSRAAVGGNGGFSFRSRSVVLRILEEEKRRQWFDAPLGGSGEWEDLFLARRVVGAGGRLPPHDFAQAFAVESMLPPPHERPLGYHNPWKYLSETELRALARVCPPISESLVWSNASAPLACRARGAGLAGRREGPAAHLGAL